MSELDDTTAVATDDCITQYIEIVPLATQDGFHTTDWDTPDWSEQEHLQQIKQEPDDVCYTVTIRASKEYLYSIVEYIFSQEVL